MCVLFCSGLCACVQKTHPADPTNGPSAVTPVCCLWICSVWMRFNLVRMLWMKPDNCVGTSLPLLFQLVVMCRRIAGVFLTALIQPWRGWTGWRSPFELRLRYYCVRRWRRNVSEISLSWEADVISLRLPAVNSQLFSHAPSFPSLPVTQHSALTSPRSFCESASRGSAVRLHQAPSSQRLWDAARRKTRDLAVQRRGTISHNHFVGLLLVFFLMWAVFIHL